MSERRVVFLAKDYKLGRSGIRGTGHTSTVITFIGLGNVKEHVQLSRGLAKELATELLGGTVSKPSPNKARNREG